MSNQVDKLYRFPIGIPLFQASGRRWKYLVGAAFRPRLSRAKAALLHKTYAELVLLPDDPVPENLAASDRREFLISLGKWSKVVIGGVLLGGSLMAEQEANAHGRDDWGGSGGIWYNSGNG